MKYIVILYALLFSILSQGQEYNPYQALDSIKSRAILRGLDLNPLIETHIESIVIWEPRQFPQPANEKISVVFGIAHFKRIRNMKYYWEIRLSRTILKDFKLLERVLAHELGHAFGLSHCCVEGSDCADDFVCTEIMAIGHISDEKNHPFFYNEQWKEVYWDNYFELIKAKHPK